MGNEATRARLLTRGAGAEVSVRFVGGEVSLGAMAPWPPPPPAAAAAGGGGGAAAPQRRSGTRQGRGHLQRV